MIDQPILVSEPNDILNIANMIPEISLGDGSRFVPVLTADRERQLIVVKDGIPITSYALKGDWKNSARNPGLESIETFFEKFTANKHLVMLYDDPVLARMVEFRYAKKGLKRGEQCMYAISEDDSDTEEKIRAQMSVFGINVEKYSKDGSLWFLSVANPAKDPGGFRAGLQKTIDSLMRQCKSPVRMIMHARHVLSTVDEISGHIEIENVIQSTFAQFPGSMLCNHYVGKNTKENHTVWTRRMLETHDNVFVLTANGGIPFVIESS